MQNNLNEAIGTIYELAKYLPENPDVLFNLGVCELLQGNKAKAHMYFSKLPEGNFYEKEVEELMK